MTPAELKQAGQMESLWATTPDIWADFVAILADAPNECSSNDTRAECDRLAIPESARGGLWRMAVTSGLVVKKRTVEGLLWRIPSTGPSAHAALVQVYLRRAL
jgi:hypothetical protein